MTNTLIDNSSSLKLIDKINEILGNENITQVCIATGYWDIPGTLLVSEALEKFLVRDGASVKLLIGEDPIVRYRYLKNPKYKDLSFPSDFIKTDINELELKPKYVPAIELLLKYCTMPDKFEIRIYKNKENGEEQFFHAKCYIFMGSDVSYGIIGSSNFTQKGLEGNSELNYLETNGATITAVPQFGNPTKGHKFWFDEKWNSSTEWTKEFLEEILKASPIGKATLNKELTAETEMPLAVLSPYEAYIKMLIDQFGDVINFDAKIKPKDYLPVDKNFKVLGYQLEAVNQGFAIMKKHGGFILADVVGLGKTYTAIMVIKRYLLESGAKRRILIITPPAVKKSWIDSIEYFDKESSLAISKYITITTIGCMDELSEEQDGQAFAATDDFDDSFVQSDYGMIVVDESHRFRNDYTIMYQKLDDLIASISPLPYIVLLSATPQNNAPYDLRNQIYLFQREHRNSTLSGLGEFGNNLEGYFKEKQDRYKEFIKITKAVDGQKISKTDEERKADREELKKDSEDIHKKIVEPLIIRRTRTDLKKYYKDDMKAQNLSFPEIQKPIAIPYEMQGELASLFNDTIDIIAPEVNRIDADESGGLLNFGKTQGKDALGYYRYRAIEFLKSEEHKKLYQVHNLTAESTSKRLAELMEMLLVKRLESSRAAFEESLENLRQYTENMIKMFEAGRIFVCPDINVNKELSEASITKHGTFEACLDALAQKAKSANKKHQTTHNTEYKPSDFADEYLELINNDKRLIDDLCSRWAVQKDDPKLETFIRKLDGEFFREDKNPDKKLVIFTECIATQNALVQKLENCASEYKVLSITAKNRDDEKEAIAANFDANYKGDVRDDYQILLTTDVLAEGVNLHRASSILNYDSPWNSTRLMQRLGRINRIGTKAEKIWNYNFYPSTLGDSHINLRNRTYIKLQAFHELFGEDSQIYSTDEEVRQFDQIIRDSDEGESPLMPYIAELSEFRKANPREYKRLSEISEAVVTCASIEMKESFVSVHVTDKAGTVTKNILYKTPASDTVTNNVSQLEMLEAIKPYSRNELAQIGESEYKKYSDKTIAYYTAQKQNEGLIIRSKSKASNEDKKNAITKIQAIYRRDDLDENLQTILDDVAESVNARNSALIRKINNFDIDGALINLIENEIKSWHNMTKAKNSDGKVSVAVQFVI